MTGDLSPFRLCWGQPVESKVKEVQVSGNYQDATVTAAGAGGLARFASDHSDKGFTERGEGTRARTLEVTLIGGNG